MNAFETLTLAPIDRRLIDLNMLSARELSWLNDYHARVRHEVRPHLDEADQSLARRGDRAAVAVVSQRASFRHAAISPSSCGIRIPRIANPRHPLRGSNAFAANVRK